MRQPLRIAGLFPLALVSALGAPAVSRAQDSPFQRFTRADTLRGMVTPLRTWYDVTYYDLDIRVDPESRTIVGSNAVTFRVLSPADTMQLDLASGMVIRKISLSQAEDLPFTREDDVVFVRFRKALAQNSLHTVTIHYAGTPRTALMPPWQGGFTWAKDSSGGPWVTVTCQGDGASLWWPCKDHQSDEPDSMRIGVTVPPGLEDVSNGRLRGTTLLPDGWTRYDWFVSYPINTYNVTVNVGKFSHWQDLYGDSLTLDYYVLPCNLERAKRQFAQVKPMLECFTHFFGPYPFVRDGYKLVESPHLGMEHQSAVAYGNKYVNGYLGRGTSPEGLLFDHIIIHESAHEWWGNSITASDIADMWIHESFGAYAEALFVEYLWGRERSLRYINTRKQNVGNREPIIGPANVNRPGSRDMYDKGQFVLNTLRSIINNDSLWFDILRGLCNRYNLSIVTADSILDYISHRAGRDLRPFFDQYLRRASLPTLQMYILQQNGGINARYRWKADIPDFDMPLKVTTAPGVWGWIKPTTSWQTAQLDLRDPADFRVAEDLFYIDTSINRYYTDPAAPPMPHNR
jgi:aminopeptidase N